MASKSNCENCNAAPAAWFCCADGAYLCARCDVAIHSANKLAMRHERIPIEVKLAKDALKCRPSTPAYDNAIMGMPQRNGTAQDAANVPTTTSALRQGGRWGGGDLGSEMDWLVMEGGEDSMHDDPLTSLLNLEQVNQGNSGNGLSLGDDLFNMAPANPSGMFAGGNGAYRDNQPVKQESATSMGSDNTQQLLSSNGTSVVRPQLQQQPQQQQQQPVMSGGQQGEVEAVLTRPFATSALRHAQLQRYRAKRLARNLGHKKIRYECRKTLADNRPRIKGRFAKVHTATDDSNGSSGALACAQSCPDLTALARLNREADDSSNDSSNKKSRLGNSSNASAVNSDSGSNKSGSAKSSPSKSSSKAKVEKDVKVKMADNGILGRIDEWGANGEGGIGNLRNENGRATRMPYTQSEVSLVALDRVVW